MNQIKNMNIKWKNEKPVVMQAGGLLLIRRRQSLRRAGVVIDTLGAEKQVNHYYPSGISMTGQWVGGLGGQPYKFGGKELDRFNTLDFYDFEARSFDPALMRFTRPDPLAEKYPGISPYAYCLNNPIKFIDPDGRDIVLVNVYKTNNNGNYDARRGISATTQSALTDLMKTKEGRNFFGQFAKEGDVVGGYTFTKNGKLSDKTLTLKDYSFEEGYNSHLPLGIAGSISFDESGITVKVVSYGENKANVGETLTHETQLHGYKTEDKMNGKKVTSAEQDHKALKSQDKSHKGYQKYDSTRKELEAIDNNYKRAFKEEEEDAKKRY
jgi:RHS repeat-associated protein